MPEVDGRTSNGASSALETQYDPREFRPPALPNGFALAVENSKGPSSSSFP